MSQIRFVQSKALHDFEGVVHSLRAELGDRFPTSIENWCGLGSRPYPLKLWEVYLVHLDDEAIPVGIASFYRQEEDPPDRIWIGWLGVVREFRRRGIAGQALALIEARVRALGAGSLWVFADKDNRDAIALYERFGMQRAGAFADTGLQQASAEEDSIVLTKLLRR